MKTRKKITIGVIEAFLAVVMKMLEDVDYFLCRDDLYNSQFKNILEPFYAGLM